MKSFYERENLKITEFDAEDVISARRAVLNTASAESASKKHTFMKSACGFLP